MSIHPVSTNSIFQNFQLQQTTNKIDSGQEPLISQQDTIQISDMARQLSSGEHQATEIMPPIIPDIPPDRQ